MRLFVVSERSFSVLSGLAVVILRRLAVFGGTWSGLVSAVSRVLLLLRVGLGRLLLVVPRLRRRRRVALRLLRLVVWLRGCRSRRWLGLSFAGLRRRFVIVRLGLVFVLLCVVVRGCGLVLR